MNRKHGLLFALLLNLTACGGGTQTNDGGATARQKQGAIVVVQSAYAQVDAGTIYGGAATATFNDITFATGFVSPCSVTTLGSCKLTECDLDAGFVTDAGSITQQSAGVITVSGTTVDGGLRLVPDGAQYAFALITGRAWLDGATLTASAIGAAVPAFSGKTLVVPSSLSLTAPACAAGKCGALSRGSPLGASWSGGSAGNAKVTLVNSGSTLIECTFPADAKSGSISAGLIAKLGVGTSYLQFSASSATRFEAGDYAITFEALSTGVAGSLEIQ